PAMQLLAAAEDQMLAHPQVPSPLCKRAAIHQLGAALGQRAFAEIRKFLVQLARQYQLQHSVAEKLEALVGLERQALLVRDGWMSERQFEQSEVAKIVTQPMLQCGVIGHVISWTLLKNSAP